MYHTADDLTRKTCAIITRIDLPLITLGAILKYFSQRSIGVQSLQMHHINPAEATLTILCQVERDRVRHTWYSLGKIEGILELEMLESRGGSLLKI